MKGLTRAPLRHALLRVAMVSVPTSFLITWIMRSQNTALVNTLGFGAASALTVVLGIVVSTAAGYVGIAPLRRDGEPLRVIIATALAGGCLGWILFPGLVLAVDSSGQTLLLQSLYTDLPLWLGCSAAGGWLAAVTGNRKSDPYDY